MQFASGELPILVKAQDLMPEVSQSEAHKAIATSAACFIIQQMGQECSYEDGTNTVDLGPLIKAFELEGSKHFNAPSQIGGETSKCSKGLCQDGSDWAVFAQRLIAGEGDKINISDKQVEMSATPVTGGNFHLPTITKDEMGNLSLTTQAQSSWEKLDAMDTGFTQNSASDMGVKMMSRQCVQIKGLGIPKEKAPFDVTDAPQFCKNINQAAYNWALKNSSNATRLRFEK